MGIKETLLSFMKEEAYRPMDIQELVSVFDIDKTPKTGYMRWRSDEGVIYAFPNIK